ncbi:hypothetical protein [Streptomyces sp. NPDC050392]|uniref:hypothetical protein n=1 Tax=unclassified Streptomyces TaxID=2593676 RepID=UPI003427EF98|nr:hypothetical protein OG450_01790 [Streptomyces sp. NBC_01104]
MAAPRHRKRLGWENVPMAPQQSALTPDGKGGLVFSGTCPRCMGTFSRTYPSATPGPVKGSGAPGGAPRPLTVLCECGVNHSGRPDVERQLGCGAHWQAGRP